MCKLLQGLASKGHALAFPRPSCCCSLAENGASSNGDAHGRDDACSHSGQQEREQQQQQQQQQQRQQQHEPLARSFWDCWHNPAQQHGQERQQTAACACLHAQNGALKPSAAAAAAAAAAGTQPAFNLVPQQPQGTAAPSMQAASTANDPNTPQPPSTATSPGTATPSAPNSISSTCPTATAPASPQSHSTAAKAPAKNSAAQPCNAKEVPSVGTHSAPVAATTGPCAASMLRRMRWASLGPQFDWTRRIYDDGAAHRCVGKAQPPCYTACDGPR
eukprot:1146854-Pelagomonas_calceolata.AAC.3